MSEAASPVTPVSESGSSKKTLILAIIVIVLAMGIGVWFYFQGKKKGKETSNLNLSSPLDSEGNAPSASDAEIRQLVSSLYTDMDGLNMFGHNLSVWNRFLALSDNDIIKVNNLFNAQYQKESEESFVEWVNNEGNDVLLLAAVNRLKKLNLS